MQKNLVQELIIASVHNQVLSQMANTLSIKAALASASALLNTEESTLEAQLLLQHALNVNRAWLIVHENDALQPNIHAVFEVLLKRRLNGEPIAYILGYREFYGLRLKVTADTLIPRPDTETLVEAALAKIPPNANSPSFRRKWESIGFTVNKNLKMDSRLRGNDEGDVKFTILDLGTGTGAIALAIAHHRPQACVTAVDASENALNIAQENAQNLNITNIKLIKSDWFGALQNEKFDLIVSNPPYIAQSDAHLSQGDLRFEPVYALASGADGLDDIKRIITTVPKHLNPYGWLMLEHGYNQANEVTALLKEAGFSEIETIKDLGGNNRVTLGYLA